jgi:hypothetical protein
MIILLCALAIQQQAITFTHPCAHSSVVLEALGKEMGVKMAPGGSVLQDYFAVKFTDRDPETVKRLLATTLNAVWVQRGEYLVLERGENQHAEEQASLDEEFKNGIKKFREGNPIKALPNDSLREKLLGMTGVQPGTTEWKERISALTPLLPNYRAPISIVHSLDDARLFAMKVGDHLKYSLDSNGKTDMPTRLKNAVLEFENEADGFESLVQQYGVTQYEDPFRPPKGDGSFRYFLELARDEYGLTGNLRREPRRSNAVSSVSVHVPGTSTTSTPRPRLPEVQGDFELSGLARSVLATIARRATFGRGPVSPSEKDYAATLEFAKDLSKNEVLDVLASQPLLQAAQQSKLDFVALIPDVQVFDGPWLAYAHNGSLNDVWSRWQWLLKVEIDAETGVVLFRPSRPATARAQRIDRAQVSRYVESFERMGFVTLDALADLMKDATDRQHAFRLNDWADRFLPVETVPSSSWFVLKAYGSLTHAQRAKARDDGVVIAWSALDADVRKAFNPILLSSGCSFSSEESGRPITWQANSYAVGNPIGEGLLSHLSSVPNNAVIKIRVYSEDLLRASPSDDGSIGGGPYDASTFAMMRSGRRDEGATNYEYASVIRVDRVNLDVYVPEVGFTYFTAQTDNTTLTTKYRPLEDLPEPMKTKLQEEIKKLGGGATWTAKQNVTHERAKR